MIINNHFLFLYGINQYLLKFLFYYYIIYFKIIINTDLLQSYFLS